MTNQDLCFLGLLALACRMIDSPEEGGAPTAAPDGAGCPRGADHETTLRADGALWCLRCDEAFYSRAPEWDAALRPRTG